MALATTSGLPVSWDNEKKELSFAGKVLTPDIRTIEQMRPVIHDTEWLKSANPDTPLYYMYRDTCLPEDKGTIEANNLRYDITAIPPYMLGKEYLKTAGHYHPFVPGQTATYPEIYEVLEGKALFFIQKVNGNKVYDARVVRANPGDKFLIPPGFAHITVNEENTTLIIANWVARDFSSVYGPLHEFGGCAYFFTHEGIIKNPKYIHTEGALKENKPLDASLIGLGDKEPMYHLIQRVSRLEFLTKPQDFSELFEKALG